MPLAMEIGTAIEQLRAATERLTSAIGGLDTDDLGAPSLLPGWTRAHVLTHLARNADGARGLLLGVRSGQPAAMYPSPALREADIEFGSRRPPEVILADALENSWRVVTDVECVSPEIWRGTLLMKVAQGGDPSAVSADRPLQMRLREVEMHHVDLDAGYTYASTPEPLLQALLDDTLAQMQRQGLSVRPMDTDGWQVDSEGGSSLVRGSPASVLAWLTGRSSGAGLDSDVPLPAVPSLG